MTDSKTVKAKIIYPHLGIIDELEEEIFEEGEENENTDVQEYERSDSRKRSEENRV